MARFLISRRAARALCAAMVAAGPALAGCAYDATSDSFDAASSSAAADNEGAVGSMMRVAEAAHKTGNLSTAVNLYRRAHAAAPAWVEPLLRLGAVLTDAGAANDAAEAYRAALAQDGENRQALRGLGEAFLALGQPGMAVSQYRAALSLAEEAESYSGLGVSLDMSGDHPGAQEAYLMAMNLEPDSPVLRNNLALSLAFDGQFEDAVSYLIELVESPQATVQHRQNLALIYGLAGRMRDAARVARMDLDEGSVQRNLAYYELLRGLERNAQRVGAIGIQRAQVNPYIPVDQAQ